MGSAPLVPAVPSDLLAVLSAVAPRLARIAVLVALGVFLANLAVAFGLVRRVAGVAGYLTRPANLPDEVGTAILATAASTTAGYGMLADYRESGLLDDRATLVAVMLNTFFGFAQHVFTFYVPVLIPILGWRTGVLYVTSRAGVALAITLTAIPAGALLLPARPVGPESTDATGTTGTTDTDDSGPDPVPGSEGDTRGERVREAAERSWRTLRRIVPRLAVVYTLVVFLVERYDVAALTGTADPLAAWLGLPGAAVPVIAVYALDTTAGAATIAPLIGGTFTPVEAVVTLLVGGIVSFAVTTFRRSIPFQYGVWGPAFGTKVVLLNTAAKLVFIGAAVALLLGAGVD